MAGFPASAERSSVIINLMAVWKNGRPEDARRWLASEQAAFLPATDPSLWQVLTASKPSSSNGPSTYSTTVNGRQVHYAY